MSYIDNYNTLKVSTLTVPSITSSSSDIGFNSKNFTSVGTIGCGTVTTTGSFSKTVAASSDIFISGRQTGDSQSRVIVYGNGDIVLGSGSATGNARIGWSSPVGFFLDDNGGGNGGRISLSGGILESVYNISTSSTIYSTGTVSQSGTTVTGSGTTFTSAMVGGTIFYNSGQHALITGFTSTTSLTVDISQTVASTGYTLSYGGCSFSNSTGYTNNLYFPTSGGTPSPLNYHETGTHSTTWSGIWASAQNGNVSYTRIGKTVTLVIPLRNATANTAASISADTVLPSRLRPSGFITQAIQVLNNSTSATGVFNINPSTGAMTIQATIGGGNFTGSGSGGLSNDCCITYQTS